MDNTSFIPAALREKADGIGAELKASVRYADHTLAERAAEIPKGGKSSFLDGVAAQIHPDKVIDGQLAVAAGESSPASLAKAQAHAAEVTSASHAAFFTTPSQADKDKRHAGPPIELLRKQGREL